MVTTQSWGKGGRWQRERCLLAGPLTGGPLFRLSRGPQPSLRAAHAEAAIPPSLTHQPLLSPRRSKAAAAAAAAAVTGARRARAGGGCQPSRGYLYSAAKPLRLYASFLPAELGRGAAAAGSNQAIAHSPTSRQPQSRGEGGRKKEGEGERASSGPPFFRAPAACSR